jgi:tetratricopeptide (TPR) repeat protein
LRGSSGRSFSGSNGPSSAPRIGGSGSGALGYGISGNGGSRSSGPSFSARHPLGSPGAISSGSGNRGQTGSSPGTLGRPSGASSFAARNATGFGGGASRTGSSSPNRSPQLSGPSGRGPSGIGGPGSSAGSGGRTGGSNFSNRADFLTRHSAGSLGGRDFNGRDGNGRDLNGGDRDGRDFNRGNGSGGNFSGRGGDGNFNRNFSANRSGSGYAYNQRYGGNGWNGGRYGNWNGGYGNYGNYGNSNRYGYGRYGYNRYGYGGLAYRGLGLVGYGLNYLGVGGWGYNPYGYGYNWGYPWGYLASRVLFTFRPFLGWGYGGYGNGGYGNSYATTYYSSTYAPVTTTTAMPIDTSVPTPDPSVAAASGDFATQAEADFQAGNYDSAVRNWQHALVDDPNNATLVMLMSQGLFATGKYDEAAGALQAALQGVPQDKWNTVVGNYRELYGNVEDYTKQLRALETASEKTESPAMQFLLGYHYGYLGFPKEAVRELDKGLKLAPEDMLARQLRDQFAPKPSTPPAAVVPKS